MKTDYYFDYDFLFFENRLLINKLRSFLDGMLSLQLNSHGYPSANYGVKICACNVYHVANCILVGDDAFDVLVYSRLLPDEVIVNMSISIVSDKLSAVTYGGRSFYLLDFERDADLFSFTISKNRVALSDKELNERIETVCKAFIHTFSLPCKISADGFPFVTFKIFFSQKYDPPDREYVLSLLGFDGKLKPSDDPYCVVIDVDFGNNLQFILRDAVARLNPLKQNISMIFIT